MGHPTGAQEGLRAQDDTNLDEGAAWAAGREAMHARIAGHFGRPEPQQQARASLQGVLSPMERKNGGPLAAHAGDRTPAGMQRRLAPEQWDADAVREDVRPYVLEHVHDSQAVWVFEETGLLNKGTTSVGVQRQYSGTAGRSENCHIGVFLAYASATGRTCIDREWYRPQRGAEAWVRRREAGVPDEGTVATTPQLARVLAAGVRVPWVTAEAV